MYRPQKRKLVRRLSTASLVAVVAAAGVGVVLATQSGATTGALRSGTATTANATSATGATTKSAAATYFVVDRRDSDASPADG